LKRITERLSKRVSTARKAKNHKNAMEKARKARKEARLNPQSKRESLKEIQDSTTKVVARENAQKLPDKLVQSNPTMAQLANEAKKRAAIYEESAAEDEQNDNSKKAYFREFKKVLDAADVLLEVLDARDPLDAVPEVADSWIKYLRKDFPTIGFKSSTQNQRLNIGQSKIHVKNADADLLSKASTVGADLLIKLLKNYSRSQNLKTSLTVGVIGYPNVGKSSLINSLKRAKVCGVGSRPGFTKVAQEIHLDAKLKLLDCPGIVFGGDSKSKPGADVLLRNCIKVELIDDPISAIEYLLNKTKWHYVMMHYDLPAFNDVRGFLIELSRKRNFVKKALPSGGILDLENAARMVLQDWNSGNIPYYTLPPKDKVSPHQTSQIQTRLLPILHGYDAVVDHSVEGDADLVATIDNGFDDMEDEAPQLLLASPAAPKVPFEAAERQVHFLEGCQSNKELRRKFKKERKAALKAVKNSEELISLISDKGGCDPLDVEGEYDFDVLAQGLPMDE
ncbi:nuclear GTP-binding protein nug1, partial [Massospora cicadina]